MNKKLLSALLVLIISYPVFAQQDTLTIEKCIDIALKNNPQLKVAQSNFDLTSANLTSVRSVLFPQIAMSASYARNGGSFFVGNTAREATYETYGTGFSASQLVFDFGKTYSKISGTSDLQHASQEGLKAAKVDLILNTYTAYYSYLQALRIKDVSKQALKQAQEHLQQAQGFFAVGTKPEYDVYKARADEASAKVTLITAENNIVVSKLQLENVLNTKLGNDFVLKDDMGVTKDTVELANAINSAFQNRPEFLSAQFNVQANKSFVTSAWTANLPAINLTGGYNWRSFSLDAQFLTSWNVGLTVTLPLFQGWALDAGIDQARANLKGAEAQLETVKQTINLDVQQQYTNLKLALAKIEATKSLLEESERALKLAEGRYKDEVGSLIEITDAQVTYLNSQILYIQSMYDYQVGYVRLKKAMGTL